MEGDDLGIHSRKLVIMNFTHTYDSQDFYRGEQFHMLDCFDIPGTHGYCDEEAADRIKGKIGELGPEGIHFIDSGNFHYVSRFWTDQIKKDFVLILIDHHTDMQLPLFEGLMSCGSWAKEVLEQNPGARGVVLIGPGEKQLSQDQLTGNRQILCLGEGLNWCNDAGRSALCGGIDMGTESSKKWAAAEKFIGGLPVYVSVDKDVLAPGIVKTDWDQGAMSLTELKEILRGIFERFEVIGVDICGEGSGNVGKGMGATVSNDRVNAQLLACLLEQ